MFSPPTASTVLVTASKQIEEKVYTLGDLEPRRFDLDALSLLLDVSSVHLRCCRAKADDVSSDYVIKAKPGIENPDPKQKEKAEAFFEECSEHGFSELLSRALIDMETYGFGILEVSRNMVGEPVKLWHAPSYSFFKKKGDTGWVQKVGIETRYFEEFPHKAVRTNGTINWNLKDLTGRPNPLLSPLEAANELVVFSLYHSLSPWYGAPDYIPVIPSIVAIALFEDYALKGLKGPALPAYAVVVSGGVLSDEDQELVEEYFRAAHERGRGDVLVMSVPGKDVQVKFQKLEEPLRRLFSEDFKKEARIDILISHGVPPARIALVEGAHLGGGRDLMQLEAYKYGIVTPRQAKVARKINKLLQMGFGITDWVFAFKPPELRDRESESKIHANYVQWGVLDPEEVREELGLPPRKTERAPSPSPEEVLGMSSDESVKQIDFDFYIGLREALTDSFFKAWDRVLERRPATLSAYTRLINNLALDLRGRFGSGLKSFYPLIRERFKRMGYPISVEDLEKASGLVKATFAEYLENTWMADAKTRGRALYRVGLSGDRLWDGLTKILTPLKGRSSLYAGTMKMLDSHIAKEVAKTNDCVLDWVPRYVDTCPDCIRMAMEGPYEPDLIPCLPGDGSTRCRGNCCCVLVPRRRGERR